MDINKLVADELSKNYQINSFTKGMNSDTAYDLVDAAQYLFGLNIRITTNTSIGGAITSNNTEQIVSPVPEPVECITNVDDESDNYGEDCMILAVAAIEMVGAVVTKTDDDHWRLYRADYDSDLNELTYTKLYTSFSTTEKDRFSITMLKEVEGVIKVYIADGINPVLCFFLRNKEIESKYNAQTGDQMKQYYAAVRNSIDEDRFFSSNSYFPYHKARLSKISGNLKTQQVQYVYRYYRRYGNVSRLSPLTNKIQIVGTNKKIELGMAEDTVTDIGMRLSITASAIEQSLFDYVQIFRISFIKAGQQPEINLICDKKLTVNLNNKFIFNDTGVQSLAEYSLEEFSALLALTLIPQTIEQNQNYLFAANVKDETTIDVDNLSVSCGLVTCPIDIDNTGYDTIPTVTSNAPANLKFRTSDNSEINNALVSDYFESCGIDDTIDKLSYENMYVSSLLRSLRRDEKYQYGIVYYDKYGNHSDVQTEGLSITTPNGSPFTTTGKANSIGLNITVTKLNDDDIVGFQIVRCEKSFDYTKNIILVALSRPMRLGKYEQDSYRTPWYPNVFLSTLFFYIHYGGSKADIGQGDTQKWGVDLWNQYFDHNGTNVENSKVYLIFSHEINIERNNVLSKISSSDSKLVPLCYVYEDRTLSESTASFESNASVITENFVAYDSNADGSNFQTVAHVEDSAFGEVSKINFSRSTPNIYVFIPHGQNFLHYTTLLDSRPSITSGSEDIFSNWSDPLDYGETPTSYTPSLVKTNNLVELTHNNIPILCDVYLNSPDFDGILNNQTMQDWCIWISFRNRSVVKYGDSLVAAYNGHLSFTDQKYFYNGRIFKRSSKNSGNYTSYLDDHPLIQDTHKIKDGVYISIKYLLNLIKGDKSSQNSILKLDNFKDEYDSQNPELIVIKDVADVKNPNWDNGFSDIHLGGDNVSVQSAIKQYKSYTTSIGGETYNNWVSNGMYDMAPTLNDVASQNGNGLPYHGDSQYVYLQYESTADISSSSMFGWIGPGPVCLLLDVETLLNESVLKKQIDASEDSTYKLGTLVANIQHTALEYDVQHQLFYGFGNFFELPSAAGTYDYYVFDGEIYPMFAEFTNLFKTYDFNERYATIPSGQVVYYIPLESKINTYFDYGLNYRNTTSSNLMLEPGQITGIASLSRPLHQYNMIYSDNDNSIDVFYAAPEKKPEVQFPQRVVYSQLKTNGENVDNFQVFKPADFIDADSRYGDITNLLSMDTNIYFWQTSAFGKLSVNERSLVTDNSGETIQLGQGGVLQRTDYISTKYGMRSQDYSAISTENAIYWIDVVNKAILQYSRDVVNYGEYLNVLNIINNKIGTYRPTIDYDIEHNELLCRCLKRYNNLEDDLFFGERGIIVPNADQLVFNIKYNIATSVYTMDYSNTLKFNNVLIGLSKDISTAGKINYIKNLEIGSLLSPTILSFVVNSNPHQTKVFDNQKVVTSKRYTIDAVDMDNLTQNQIRLINSKISSSPSESSYRNYKTYSMCTDLHNNENDCNVTIEPITDREGNICYSIPRWGDTNYGNRLRGKWLKETIVDNMPNINHCISHIITKFRQSYS